MGLAGHAAERAVPAVKRRHLLEHLLRRDLIERAEHLDQGRPEALPRTVARRGEPSHQPPHRVAEVRADFAAAAALMLGLRRLESGDERCGCLDAPVHVERGQIPEEAEHLRGHALPATRGRLSTRTRSLQRAILG
jgi:hypothetical protein